MLDRVDGSESVERHVRGDRARVAAAAAPDADPHPLGEMTFNPAARPGDADWRVMYLGAGDAGSGEQRDSRRLNPQRLDTFVGKILRIIPDLREHTDHEHGQRERSLPHPERQPVRDGRRRAQGDLGVRSAQSASACSGTSTRRGRARRRSSRSTSGSSRGKRWSSFTKGRTTDTRCVRARRACRRRTGWARCLSAT